MIGDYYGGWEFGTKNPGVVRGTIDGVEYIGKKIDGAFVAVIESVQDFIESFDSTWGGSNGDDEATLVRFDCKVRGGDGNDTLKVIAVNCELYGDAGMQWR